MGKARNHYNQVSQLRRCLKKMSDAHPYSLRFEKAWEKGYKRAGPKRKQRDRRLALRLIHLLDEKRHLRRADVISHLLSSAAKYSREDIQRILKRLAKYGLVKAGKSGQSRVSIT